MFLLSLFPEQLSVLFHPSTAWFLTSLSLVLSLVLLLCPLSSLGHCALLKKVKAKPEFSRTCSFLGLTECKTSSRKKNKSLDYIIAIASMLWWVCFSPAETMLYGNSKLKSPMWNLLGVTLTSSSCS